MLTCGATTAWAGDGGAGDSDHACAGLPTHHQLKVALESARAQSNGGFNLDMWGTVVNRDGIVCAVAFTGTDRGSQWPGSRVISAQKANTANAFSLPGLALSTANLYAAVQPGGRSRPTASRFSTRPRQSTARRGTQLLGCISPRRP